MTENRNEKQFWGWWKKKSYSPEQVEKLVEKIKAFNAGAIDEYLTRHVDQVFAEWLKEHE